MAFVTRIAEAIITMIFMLLVLYVILQSRVDTSGPAIIAGLDLFEIIVMIFMFVIALYQRKVSVLQTGNSTKLDTILKDLRKNHEEDLIRSERIGRLENRADVHLNKLENHEERIQRLEERKNK